MPDPNARRPLASRDTGWARALTRGLAARGITPNQISAASVIAAALACICLAMTWQTDGWAQGALLVGGALCVQVRLLCNLMDGMVAVEAEQASATGPFWNEVPDRLADVLILVGVGLGAGVAWLGWAAAALAVTTAYLRAFGASLDRVQDFRGPMAKPHRMAAVTLGALGGAALGPWVGVAMILQITLGLVVAGTAFTAYRRAAAIRDRLRGS